MKILDVANSREVDRLSTEHYGIPSLVLMENAALGIVEAIGESFPAVERVLIFCGPGNNGGDGLAAARHLDLRGYEVELLLLGDKEFAGDAAVQEGICRRQGVRCRRLRQESDLAALSGSWQLIVDALFGVGLSRPLAGLFAVAAEWIVAQPVPCLAVDLPSGLAGDSEQPPGPHVVADLTVTFETPKPAHVLPPASDAVGGLVVADLGIPPAVVAGLPSPLRLLTPERVAGWLPQRGRAAHKGTLGHVLVVAGALGMGGAAVLAARAALRGGAGLVTSAVPDTLLATVDAAALEAMTLPLPASEAGGFDAAAAAAVIAAAATRDLLAIGPGLGTSPGAAELVRAVLDAVELPAVVDASAIGALAGHCELLRSRPAPTVLTPHVGELARLLEVDPAAVAGARLAHARQAALDTGCVVVLKGQATLIAEPDGTVWVNATGNPGLATGGSGDVLTGLLAALWAQLLSGAADEMTEHRPGLQVARRAAALAAYVHGLAGDLAAEEIGELALVASDLLPRIGPALKLVAAA